MCDVETLHVMSLHQKYFDRETRMGARKSRLSLNLQFFNLKSEIFNLPNPRQSRVV